MVIFPVRQGHGRGRQFRFGTSGGESDEAGQIHDKKVFRYFIYQRDIDNFYKSFFFHYMNTFEVIREINSH